MSSISGSNDRPPVHGPGQGPPQAPSTTSSITSVATHAIAGVGLLLAAVTLGAFIGTAILIVQSAANLSPQYRKYEAQRKELINALGTARLQTLKEQHNNLLAKPAFRAQSNNFPHTKKIINKIENLIRMDVKPEQAHWHAQKIRRLLLMGAHEYLKESAKHVPFTDYTNYFREMLITIRSKVPMNSLFGKFAEQLLDLQLQNPNNVTVKDLEQALANVPESFSMFDHETLFHNILHRFAYPWQALGSLHAVTRPLQYNPYESGNCDGLIGDIKITINDKEPVSIAWNYGPSPGNRDTALNLIHELDKIGESNVHSLVHGLQKPQGAEAPRFRRLAQMGQDYDHMQVVASPMDGAAMKLKVPELQDAKTPQDFCAAYHTYATGRDGKEFKELPNNLAPGTGFYCQEGLLSDEQFAAAFTKIGQALEGLDLKDGEDKIHICQGIQLLVQSALALGSLHSMAASAPEGARLFFTQACKQDVDRGVAENILTRVLINVINGIPFSKEDLLQMVGAAIGRAEIVDGRCILSHRLNPLLSALAIIAKHQEQLQTALQSYLSEWTDCCSSVQLEAEAAVKPSATTVQIQQRRDDLLQRINQLQSNSHLTDNQIHYLNTLLNVLNTNQSSLKDLERYEIAILGLEKDVLMNRIRAQRAVHARDKQAISSLDNLEQLLRSSVGNKNLQYVDQLLQMYEKLSPKISPDLQATRNNIRMDLEVLIKNLASRNNDADVQTIYAHLCEILGKLTEGMPFTATQLDKFSQLIGNLQEDPRFRVAAPSVTPIAQSAADLQQTEIEQQREQLLERIETLIVAAEADQTSSKPRTRQRLHFLNACNKALQDKKCNLNHYSNLISQEEKAEVLRANLITRLNGLLANPKFTEEKATLEGSLNDLKKMFIRIEVLEATEKQIEEIEKQFNSQDDQ